MSGRVTYLRRSPAAFAADPLVPARVSFG